MKKITLIPLIIIVIGVCIALAGFAGGGMKGIWFDRGGFHLDSADRGALVKVDETYDSFKNIEVNVDFLDIVELKEGNTFSVRGQNYENYGGLEVEKVGDRLIVNAIQRDRWFVTGLGDLRRNWNAKDCKVEITYPSGTQFSAVDVRISAGRLSVNSLECGVFEVMNDFGNVDINGVTADRMAVNLSAGDTGIRNIEASTLLVSNDFGRITLESATLDKLTLSLSAGDLVAKDVSTETLSANSSFGNIRFDRLILGGFGEIEQSSGEVNVNLDMSEDDVSYELYTDAGSVSVDGRRAGSSLINRASGTTSTLNVNSDFGSISLKFLR